MRVDGLDLRRLDLASYRARLGIVPQDAFVFRGTVASNVAYGRPDAARTEIEAAVRAVGAADVLGLLAGGLDHVVEEDGTNLTTAQRQLIALARAWLTHPDVLVLDEATSALDAPLERAVIAAVAALGCTTLMVTHREDVVLTADEVVVLSEGCVVQIGTPRRAPQHRRPLRRPLGHQPRRTRRRRLSADHPPVPRATIHCVG